jgi:hypothetical protein
VEDWKYLPSQHPEAKAWVRAKRRNQLELVSAIFAFATVGVLFVAFCRILTS